MSRSRKKTPISGNTTADTEKDDKRIANRAFRRIAKRKLKNAQDDHEDCLPKDLNEVSNLWSFNKDGKTWWNPSLHGDKDWYLRMMRK